MPISSATPARVLVFGDDTRSFLAVTRGLGRHGIEVHAAPANLRSPALRSRYITALHRLPPYVDDGAAWVGAVEALQREYEFDALIPCDETTLLPLVAHRARLAPLVTLGLPNERALEVFFDKKLTRELAAQLDIPVAPGRLLTAADTPARLVAEFGAPLLLKPRRSYLIDRLHVRQRVHVLGSVAAIADLLAKVVPDESLVEGYFAGQGIGFSVLANAGEISLAFQHERVHERIGSSYYRVSAPPAAALREACAKLVRAVAFSGIAMLEFRRNSSGAFVLLEVNARPWGSMPLALAAGVDFAWDWYRQLVRGETIAPHGYRVGLYGRNLLPDLRDIVSASANEGGLLRRPARLVGRLVSLLRPLVGQEVHDVLVLDDPRPGLCEVWLAAAKLRHSLGRRVPGIGWLAANAAEARFRAAWRGSGDIVFVCLGNICRSCFAEHYARRHYDTAKRFLSAGMIALPGRQSPANAIAAGQETGIDLADHRSMVLTTDMIDTAAALICFDARTEAAVLDRYPEVEHKLFRLDQLGGTAEIADPLDGDMSVFRSCYATIGTALDRMLGKVQSA